MTSADAVFAATAVQVAPLPLPIYHHAVLWPLMVNFAAVLVIALAVRSSVVNALAVASSVEQLLSLYAAKV